MRKKEMGPINHLPPRRSHQPHRPSNGKTHAHEQDDKYHPRPPFPNSRFLSASAINATPGLQQVDHILVIPSF